MSATGFLILLIVTIALLMVLIMKVKLHPTFALFASALFMGLVLGRFEAEGFSFTEVLSLITSGFGGTLGSMGIPIMLGAILAMGVQDTGAAKAIANFFIKLFRGKNLELAPALTAYIVSIPVFGDITTILTSNIANVLSKRKHISMGKMAAFTQTGLNLTRYQYRGIVTFVSERWVTEYMHLFTADGWTGEIGECSEGVLEWVPRSRLLELPHWEGDAIFLDLLARDVPFFSLKLRYDKDDQLVEAVLNGEKIR